MDASDSNICADHLGVEYRFCMAQCRENFLARPLLYLGKQSPIKAGRQVIKRRRFTLDCPVVGLQRDALLMELNKLMSVRNIRVEGDRLSIDYNLLEVTVGQIEATLVRAGALMGSGWSERLKRGWIHYTEETELDNLATGESACCNKSPTKG
jgi:YHS domain-containing protein